MPANGHGSSRSPATSCSITTVGSVIATAYPSTNTPCCSTRSRRTTRSQSGSTQSEVRSWLRDLPEREGTVLALRYGADLAARDIGQLLELTEANVHQILSRTLRKLRTDVERTLT